MTHKKYDCAVVVGEYTDRQTGQPKKKWRNVGVVLQTDNGHCLLLDRTFNPAGVADPDNRGTVMVSLFEPKDQQQNQPAQQTPPSSPDPDDDIPF